MIYKLYNTSFQETTPDAAMSVAVENQVSFIFDPDNTDYQNFKAQINADEAQLEDADGNLMTDAKAFVATLP